MSIDFVYLASGSPRLRPPPGRTYRFVATIHAAADEAVLAGEAPVAYVTRLAKAKAEAGWEKSRGEAGRDATAIPVLADISVLAADTAVVLDGKILGKPTDRADALGMLRQLSGRTHEVLTAVALRTTSGLSSRLSSSRVTFRSITAAEADEYWTTGEPKDKAGAYAIQGRAAVFIADLQGSYSGVMGLPLFETAELLGAPP